MTENRRDKVFELSLCVQSRVVLKKILPLEAQKYDKCAADGHKTTLQLAGMSSPDHLTAL